MALMGLVYRDKLFPRQAYGRAFEAMIASLPARVACRTMVDLLALAHDRACEAELGEQLTQDLDAGRLPDMNRLRVRFTPDAEALPEIVVTYTPLSLYDELATVFTGVSRMKPADPIDAGRLTLALNDLRLPAIKTIWPRLRRARRQGRLARSALPGRAHRARAGRTREPAHPAPSRRGPPAARQDPRQLRLRSRANDQQGPGHGPRRRRQLARQGRQSLDVRPARRRQVASGGGPWVGARGERLARLLHPHHRSRATPSRPLAATSSSKPLSPSWTNYHLLILDDLAYVTKDQAETSVLFELISARYERRSLLITANQPFGEWERIFPDQAMTLAAVDRLVHHATIFEMNVESFRRRAAIQRKQGPGRPPTRATIKGSASLVTHAD